MREPKSDVVGHIRFWEWRGAGPTLLMCHATGFHGRCWDQIIKLLPEHWRIIAPDMRGHGASGNPDGTPHWKLFGADMAMLIDALELDAITGVGHSMGGHSVVHAAALRPFQFRSLILLDPVIRAAYGAPWVENHFARKRRNQWTSPDEMYERFKDRPPFAAWHPQVLRDYCDYALNGNVLACAPDFEASVYENSSLSPADIGDELGSIAAPVTVIRSHLELRTGHVDMNGSPTDPKLASRFQRGVDIEVPYSHFFPMEVPDLVASRIREQIPSE